MNTITLIAIFNQFRYSSNEFPNLRIRPQLSDRILEAVTLSIVVATWAYILYAYFNSPNRETSSHLLAYLAFGLPPLLLCAIAYLPIRFWVFPVRINAKNVVTQFFLVQRWFRVFNILASLLFLLIVVEGVGINFDIAEELIPLIAKAILILMLVTVIVYYIIASRYNK